MNRGSPEQDPARSIIQSASMRPRFMNRGSRRRANPLRTRRAGFNEAPIHESGKSKGGSDSRAVRPASMRPRFMNRGSAAISLSALKSSYGFNEAPIHESGKLLRGSGSRRERRVASMRPRFMNRGSAGVQSTEPDRALASMRPRFMNRGSESAIDSRIPYQRRFNEAPIHESGKCGSGRYPKYVQLGFNEAPIHESGKCDRLPAARRLPAVLQ